MLSLRGLPILAAIAAFLAGAPLRAAGGEVPAPVGFTLDGKPIEPYVISLSGAPERPAAGDVVVIDDFLFTLGADKTYNLKSTPDEDGRLLLVAADGSTSAIAAKVGWTYEGDKKVVFNPLAKMTGKELHSLRGLRLDEWPEGTDEKLKLIDPEVCCVTVTDNTARGKSQSFPSLPEALRYLNVEKRSGDGIKNYLPLTRLASLKFLAMDPMPAPLNAGLLMRNVELEYLDLGGVDLKNAGQLGTLKGLRTLILRWSRNLDDIGFVAGMMRLRRLDLQCTKVTDLSPLAGLAELASVDANRCPVSKLPAGELPALRKLGVLSTQLSDEAVAQFRKANPACVVAHHWEETLVQALAGTSRIRVRSGGTCHRHPAKEKTLFEEKDADQIKAVLTNVKINERKSQSECMCCGNPSFEFYKGDELVATLGFHHGRSLRWPGNWPADGELTKDSAEYLAKWLAGHGVKGPEEERESEKKQQEAAKRRMAATSKLLPADVLAALKAAESDEDAAAAFEKVADRVARADLAFKLLGCDDGSWNLSCGLDQILLENVIPGLGRDALSKALEQASKDPGLANGAGRWVFGQDKAASVDARTLESALPALAAQGLGHPRQINRRRTIRALGELKGETATKLLRGCLAGEVKVRPLAPEDAVEPGGMVEYRPGDSEAEEGCSDRAYAALVLAKLGDKESLPAIKELAGAAKGSDGKALGKALELLGAKP